MRQGSLRRLRGAVVFGPGLVYFLSSVGASDIFLNSVIGATYGYSLLWTLLLVAGAQYVVLETSSRYVVVTGESVLTGITRYGGWLAWVFLVTFFVRRHLGNLVHIVLMGNAVHLLFPLPTVASEKLWSIAFLVTGMLIVVKGGYLGVERSMKPLFAVMAGAFLLIGLMSKPDFGAILGGLLIPSIPAENGDIRYSLLLMALLGAGSSSIAILKYSAFVQERKWDRLEYLKRQRKDLILCVGCIALAGIILQAIAAASALSLPESIRGASDLVPAYSETFGVVGRAAFAATLWSASCSTFIGANTGYGLLVADIVHNLLPGFQGRSGQPTRHRPKRELASTPAYRWVVVAFCLSPSYVLLTSWKPVPLVIVASCFLLLLVPAMGLFLILLTNDRKRLGAHVSGPITNAALVVVMLAAVYITWVNAVELWGDFKGFLL